MYSLSPPSTDVSPALLPWHQVLDWAQEHDRCQTLHKDEQILVRSGRLYLVQSGVVRLSGKPKTSNLCLASDGVQPPGNRRSPHPSGSASARQTYESFLGFAKATDPFEITTQSSFQLKAHAHLDHTQVIWMYWTELDRWAHCRQTVLDAFRHRHNRQLLLLGALGQRRACDRLMGFLEVLMEEYGERYDSGYCLPWPVTQTQIAGAIGATRVTVTRLMGQLRHEGLIAFRGDNQICFPFNQRPLL
ncbi:Crp/Fnr family transcriptional regulator [Prochlorothrix hollandica]|uniref:Transcriptional regulator n=1 Tax=Prochlorothrix hollandica PCC 9006 = CALU 1027 TaxID=317619 RepID=A0A0M2PVM9_PROHO|nr:Crp/Fnr family transcriptional regulator [Prochlorothrix hollandica]KKI98416.1 transcriptional regulator [Prochlorothrix hollandica PCC 9006 = CALU 1027]